MSIARGLALALTHGQSVSDFPTGFANLLQRSMLGFPLVGYALLAFYAVAFVLHRRSVFGRHVTAIGSSLRSAVLCGVPMQTRLVQVFALSGFCSALGGIMLASRLNSAHPLAGTSYELDAIAATVLGGASLSGGKASLPGAFVGVLLLVSLRNGLSMLNFSSYAQQVCIGVIIVSAVAFDMATLKSRSGEQLTIKESLS